LGLGVLSVAPSSAAVIGLTVTSVNGTATTAVSDSRTAASLRVTYTAQAAADSVTITSFVSSKPATAGAIAQSGIVTHLLDTTTSTVVPVLANAAIGATSVVRGDSVTVVANINSATSGQVSANFAYYFLTAPSVAGTYTITSIITPLGTGTPVTKTLDIVVSETADESLVASSTYSTLGDPTATNVLATASSTAAATLALVLRNAANNTAARESVTATITGAGTIGNASGGTVGKSVVLQYDSTSLSLGVFADGTAGVGTITVSTPSVTFPSKTVTFYSATPATAVASVNKPVIEASSVSTSDVVRVAMKDSLGNIWSGDAWMYATSAASALIAGSETPFVCGFDTGTDQRHECVLTGKLTGTAKFKVINASTVAAATLTSNEVEVRVAVATPASVKLVFDKSTYGPGEKARLSVVVLDAAGAQIVGKQYDAILAAGGITPSVAFSAGSDTLTATSVVVSPSSSSTSGTTAGQQNYVVYMPMSSGDVTVTATGSTGLPLAARVAVTATATVANSSVDAATDAANEATDAANAATDAALAAADAADAATAAAEDASAAVATLAASVSTALGNLKKQITALTALVNKLLKK